MTDQSTLPGRTPQPATPPQRTRRVDKATLMRVRDSMRALGWTPHSFTGSSFIDIEAVRAMAEEARSHG